MSVLINIIGVLLIAFVIYWFWWPKKDKKRLN
jgi:phage shock protein PspC (stress-responsive transcriptional regulator)